MRHRIGTRPATQSTRRISSRVGPRSELGNAIASVTFTTPCVGGERGLQHVGVGQIASLRSGGDLGPQREASTAVGVQDGREHARRVEVGQAQPVDGPVARDQRDGPPVPDRGVVADRDIASRGSAGRRAQTARRASRLLTRRAPLWPRPGWWLFRAGLRSTDGARARPASARCRRVLRSRSGGGPRRTAGAGSRARGR